MGDQSQRPSAVINTSPPSWQHKAQRTLISLGAPHVVTTQDLIGYARMTAGSAPPSATVSRWIRHLVVIGSLEPVSRGVYLNRCAGPSVHAAEAAQYIRRGAVVSLAWVLERCGALNNYSDTVTCVVPLIVGLAPPKVGERRTLAAPFRFYGLPQRLFQISGVDIGDLQDLGHGYPRATPERALLEWIYLGASGRSRLPPPPLDLSLDLLDQERIVRLAKAMQIEDLWAQWHADWSKHASADDVLENSASGLGF